MKFIERICAGHDLVLRSNKQVNLTLTITLGRIANTDTEEENMEASRLKGIFQHYSCNCEVAELGFVIYNKQ